MKKKTAFTLALLALAFGILACGFIQIGDDGDGQRITGTGPLVEQDRDVTGVTGVELATLGTLHISLGSATSLRVEAQENLMEYIETEVRGGTLLIRNIPGYDLRSTKGNAWRSVPAPDSPRRSGTSGRRSNWIRTSRSHTGWRIRWR